MARVLLIGPDRERATGLRSLLRRDGHQVTWLRSADGWNDRERELAPEIVITAVGSTGGLFASRRRPPSFFPAPLLLVQQEADFLAEVHQQERLVDRLTSPFMGEELLGRVDALVRVRRIVHRDSSGGNDADSGRRRPFGRQLSAWLRSRLPRDDKPLAPYLEVAARLAEWTDKRDAFKPGHAERVTSFCGMIADGLDLGEEETATLLRASMLHDIGKVAMPIEVLHQKSPLEEAQRRLIRTHPARGAALLRALDPDSGVARVVLCHHERPDGSGYYGKEAGGVPRSAYVLAVAEAYDAMTSSLLREPLSSDEALAKLQSTKGEQYDADSVDALVDVLQPRATCIPLSPYSPAS